METVTISPKFQVVIPSRVRELLGVRPGQKVRVFLYDNRIETSPPTWTATRALWTSPPSPTPAAARRPSWTWEHTRPC